MARSALERDSTLLNTLFELSSAGIVARAAARVRRARRNAPKNPASLAGCSPWWQ